MAKENKTKLNSKKIKEPKNVTEEGETIRSFILIFGAILIIVLIIYLVSVLVVNNRENNKFSENDEVNTNVKIDYNLASVGMILNRPYDNYYVMVYDGEDPDAIYYAALITKYQNKEKDKKKIYFTDLSESINSGFKNETSNPKATTTSEFAFGKVTLLEINKGKITRYVESIDTIKEILQ